MLSCNSLDQEAYLKKLCVRIDGLFIFVKITFLTLYGTIPEEMRMLLQLSAFSSQNKCFLPFDGAHR